MKIWALLLVALGAVAGDDVADRWPLEALRATPAASPAELVAPPGVNGVFLDALPYKGRKTKFFAWYGVPAPKPGAARVPGVVLLHGGGGTASADWVKRWNEHGFAAIAPDLEGNLPPGRTYHPLGGPPNSFEYAALPLADQWPYHAVADALLSNSFLRSLPGVEPGAVGVVGLSWGGMLTLLAAGVDARFKFAVPVYGCGYYGENPFFSGLARQGKQVADNWLRLWDPSHYIPGIKAPTLWLTGVDDPCFPLNLHIRSFKLMTAPKYLRLKKDFPHGTEPVMAAAEIYAFAQMAVNGKITLPEVGETTCANGMAAAKVSAVEPVKATLLFHTEDAGAWKNRKWLVAPVENSRAAALPKTTTAAFFTLMVDDVNGASSIPMEWGAP